MLENRTENSTSHDWHAEVTEVPLLNKLGYVIFFVGNLTKQKSCQNFTPTNEHLKHTENKYIYTFY
jgi:hypothetical protein